MRLPARHTGTILPRMAPRNGGHHWRLNNDNDPACTAPSFGLQYKWPARRLIQ